MYFNATSTATCHAHIYSCICTYVHIATDSNIEVYVYTYTVNNKPIIKQIQHKDLGINFTNDLQWNKHYIAITTKAYQTLGLICRTFKQISVTARKQLYISLVRSQLMYCSPLRRPQLLKDIFTLERIQRRATKFILNNYDISYKTRLIHLNLLPLMYILELNDIMFFVKSLKAPSDYFNIYQYVHFANNSTRSASFSKLFHIRPTSSIHHHFYFSRIVRLWNHMPIIDLSLSTKRIKTRLTLFLWNKFINSFNSDQLCSYHVLYPCYRCSTQPIVVNFNELPTL